MIHEYITEVKIAFVERKRNPELFHVPALTRFIRTARSRALAELIVISWHEMYNYETSGN
jgi:hypothetical protein